MGLKIIGTVGATFRICLSEKIAVLNKETGLYDQARKVMFTGPMVTLYPVYGANSTRAKYYTAEVKLDEPNSPNPKYFNLKTGKPVSYTDAIMSLTTSQYHMLTEGQIAVAVTPDTVESVREALKLGFPLKRVNDSLGLLSPANKEVEVTTQPEIILDDITLDDEREVSGIKDLMNLTDDNDDLDALLEDGVEKGIVVKKGNWYDFKTTTIGPGKAKAIKILETAPSLVAMLKTGKQPNLRAQDLVKS